MVYLSCSYIPYEIPLASGMPTKRGIFERTLPSMEGYLPRDFCPYAKAFLRHYGNDDVIAIAESCDAMRRVYDVLRYWNLAGSVHFIDVPRTCDSQAVAFYGEELRSFAASLVGSEALLSAEFQANLKSAIEGMNKIRMRLSKVFDLLSKGQISSLTATRLAMSVNQILSDFPATRDCGVTETNSKYSLAPGMIRSVTEKAEELTIRTISESHLIRQDEDRIPVGVTGTCLLDLSLLDCIDSAGLDVVFIDSCLPMRTYSFIVESDSASDPFYDLAEAYLRKPPCPRMFRGKEQVERIYKQASDYGAQGIIYFAPKFCDQAYYDFLQVRRGLRSLSCLPVLLLEGQYGVGNTGQAATRLSAFREMLEARRISKEGKHKCY